MQNYSVMCFFLGGGGDQLGGTLRGMYDSEISILCGEIIITMTIFIPELLIYSFSCIVADSALVYSLFEFQPTELPNLLALVYK